MSSIDRIEIIRGSSAGVIYGSGAIGGAINIVTKDSNEISNTLNLNYGSYESISVDFTSSMKINENNSLMIAGRVKESDTFRESNDYEREDILIRINSENENINSYLDFNSSSKNQLLSGTRLIGGVYNYHLCNLYSNSMTARNVGGGYARNANSCNSNQRDDYADEKNNSIAGGLSFDLSENKNLNLDLSNKNKEQNAFYAANGNTISTPNNGDRYIVTELENSHVSLIIDDSIFIKDNLSIIKYGFEISDTSYNSKRYRNETESVGQIYNASQGSRAIFVQASINLPGQSGILSLGARDEKTNFSGADEVNRSVTGFINSWDATDHDALSSSSSNTALNIGYEQILNKDTKFFAKYAESFRTPNIDERIQSTTTGSFALNDQSANEIEIGLRYKKSSLDFTGSIYVMDTENEIQYNQSENTNLDPIKREGINIDLKYSFDYQTIITASYSHVSAKFTSGLLTPGNGGSSSCDFSNTTYCSNSQTWQTLMGGGTSYSLSGKSVPLIAPNTFNLSFDRKLSNATNLLIDFDYTDEKFVSNDQENVEKKIPAYFLINSKLVSINGPFAISAGINNLLDKNYYNFAVSSTFHDDDHFGTQAVYPLAGRNAFVNIGYSF